ncbi:MAG: glycosyl hydrolase-related protein [Terriglobia bacterium]
MDRRRFLEYGGMGGLSWYAARLIPGFRGGLRLLAAGAAPGEDNPNWAGFEFKATAKASSYAGDPPWGYGPANVFGDNLFVGWQANDQAQGAWIEIGFPEVRPVSEVWILPDPLPRDILGQAPYILTYSRLKFLETPRHIQIELSGGQRVSAELHPSNYFQIITFPQTEQTSSLRITVEDVWSKPGGQETGIGKVKVFPEKHALAFEIDVHTMYDARNSKPIQSATLHLINPGEELRGGTLRVSRQSSRSMRVPLEPVPARSVSNQDVWIPALFEDSEMEFEIVAGPAEFCCKRALQVPAYHSYFDGGTFSLNCTCHNDLGWLDTQAKTADYRSAEIILPALKLLKEYPEFLYSMECTAYLMEFLDRHPDLRGEMAAFMRDRRFTWGASYVECQEVHVGPEKLVRQFYFGRRWLKKAFPGVDTHFYVKTDPPSMTLQMPQILAKAGVKYCIQGRMPFGFYNWEAPDGTILLTYGYHYVDPMRLLDPKDNRGWLRYAKEREYYYRPRHLPRMFIYDYTSDYLPPQPALPPYVRVENQASERFAAAWNNNFPGKTNRQIHPPRMLFTTPEAFLDEFTKHPLDITTLRGDWPFSWAYYDEPSNREGLLLGRKAHNELLAAERLYAGLGVDHGFPDYPASEFEAAWKANTWPDHGWGGNHGTVTDKVYNDSYAKSKTLADQIASNVGSKVAHAVAVKSGAQVPVVVYNPLSWERTAPVACNFTIPAGWRGLSLRDDAGHEVPYEVLTGGNGEGPAKILFIAHNMPSIGYRTFYLEPSTSAIPGSAPANDEAMENQFLRVAFGKGGVKSLFDKKKQWETLRTDKFDGGEVLQFTAPGNAWEDTERVTMKNFDRTANHDFPFKLMQKTPVRATAIREAQFKDFRLRESFHLYDDLDRLDIGIDVLNWDGQIERELRAAFPINLDEAQLSYEVPFGTVEMGKDELDFSLLPPDKDTQFTPEIYGGNHPLPYREAINWIDASSPDYLRNGCLAASDSTVHLFRDETDHPVSYPVLQHVLLSTRKSLAWNPDYWFTQKGSHRYRMALLPHRGDWRRRYRDAIGFNYPLAAFVGGTESAQGASALPSTASFLMLDPLNLVLTAMKKSEDDDRIVLRFYEAEGFECTARIRLPKPIRQAWKASLIEEDEGPLHPSADGSLQFTVRPWEIVTVKVQG